MPKVKILITLAGVLCMVGVSAAPANAWFQGKTAEGQAIPPTLVSFSFSPAGASFTCEKEGAEIHWRIQSGTKLNGSKQLTQNPGPHQELNIAKWGNKCFVTVAGLQTAATVTPCQLQIEQPTKSTAVNQTAVGSVVSECNIKALGCSIKAPAQKPNERLGKAGLEASAEGLKVTASVAGITTEFENPKTETTKCNKLGIKPGKEGQYVTEGAQTLIEEGVSLV